MLIKDREARTSLYYRYNKASDGPLLVLALLMIPIIIAPEVVSLSAEETTLLDTADWFIYAIFALDFTIKIYLAPSALRHIRENWIDLFVLALPLLRPLRLVRSARLLRLLRATRLLVFALEGIRKLRGILTRRSLHVVLLITLALIVACAGLVAVFERDSGGSIKDFPDALWWAVTTVTTVGYGDTFPVTPEGRGIAVFLMVLGICFFGILTANIAAYFVESSEARENAGLEEKLDLILQRLDAMEAAMGGSPGVDSNSRAQVDNLKSRLSDPIRAARDQLS